MPLITDEMRKAIGFEVEPFVIEVEKGMITRLTEAVGDPNPLWRDESSASQSHFQEIVAPPSLIHAAMMSGGLPKLPFDIPLKRRLDGGGDWEYFLPIKSRDHLTVVTRLSDLQERQSDKGPMIFVTLETDWKNAKGELMARSHTVVIYR